MWYYASKYASADGHEVHAVECMHLSDPESHVFLGEFFSAFDALEEARKLFREIAPCRFCTGA